MPEIIESFKEGLMSLGFRPAVYRTLRIGTPLYELEVRGTDVIALLLLLRFRHPEKIAAKRLVLKYNGTPWALAERPYRRLPQRIRRDRDEFVKLAELAYHVWPLRRAQRHEVLVDLVRAAQTMRQEGSSTKKKIMERIVRSERTVYRYLADA